MKPEDRKRLKQHIEMIVEHKTPIEELEDMNRKLRLELHTLRFKEAQEQRFIWWIWNVYVKNVEELITDIMRVTTYDTEGEAKEGKYSLPKHCFDLMKKIDEYTEHIYDGTYLDVEISTDVKTSSDTTWLENEGNTGLNLVVCGKCRTVVPPQLDRYQYKYCPNCGREITAKDTNPDYYNHAKTSSDNNKGE